MSNCTEVSILGAQNSQELPAQVQTSSSNAINTTGHNLYKAVYMGEIRDFPADSGLFSHPTPSSIERDNYLNYMLHEENKMRRKLKELRQQLVKTNKAMDMLAGGIASVQAEINHLSTQFDEEITTLYNRCAGL